MMQREDFSERLEQQQPIHAHEIQYPIMQGWDSVMVKADVELGGTDQLFNILVGRDFQKEEKQPQQVVMTMPLLEGVDGVKKMSKSLGNFVGVSEPATDMFGKLMSISDQLMNRYYELLLGRELPNTADPFESKKQLAAEIVKTYHSADVAQKTLADWNARFSEKRLEEAELPMFEAKTDQIVALVVDIYSSAFGTEKSRGEASRLIKQGSVQVDGKKITDPKTNVALKSGQILRLDKTHAVRIK